ncbi:MAG: extracellular solute-binding protein, partial [bacterium]
MKKLLALALTLCLLLGVCSFASAADTTTLTMWTFIAQHQEFFEKAAARWNEANPDRPIAVEVTTIGYDDMHNKFKVALQSDEGAPDMCDVELGQFPNVLAFSDKLVDL